MKTQHLMLLQYLLCLIWLYLCVIPFNFIETTEPSTSGTEDANSSGGKHFHTLIKKTNVHNQ